MSVSITSGTSTDPTLDVIDKPVGSAIASLSSPHSPSLQACAPQPVLRVVSAFQYAWPQVNLPHPEVVDMVDLLR